MAERGRAAATWHLLLATVHLVLDVTPAAAAAAPVSVSCSQPLILIHNLHQI